MWTVAVLLVFFGDLRPYLVVRLVQPRRMMSLATQALMLFNLGVWMPRGTFLVVTLQESLSDHIAKFSLFSLRAVPTT